MMILNANKSNIALVQAVWNYPQTWLLCLWTFFKLECSLRSYFDKLCSPFQPFANISGFGDGALLVQVSSSVLYLKQDTWLLVWLWLWLIICFQQKIWHCFSWLPEDKLSKAVIPANKLLCPHSELICGNDVETLKNWIAL